MFHFIGVALEKKSGGSLPVSATSWGLHEHIHSTPLLPVEEEGCPSYMPSPGLKGKTDVQILFSEQKQKNPKNCQQQKSSCSSQRVSAFPTVVNDSCPCCRQPRCRLPCAEHLQFAAPRVPARQSRPSGTDSSRGWA